MTLRPLPLCMEPAAFEAAETKESLLQRYRPAFAARQRVRQLAQRIAGREALRVQRDLVRSYVETSI